MICGQAHLTRAIDCLGPALVPEDAARQLLSFAATLPDAASGHILECRLGGGTCDYSQVLTRGDGGFDAFAGHIRGSEFWQDTARLLAATQGQLRDAGVVWMEFDAAKGGMSRPGFFVSPHADATDADTGVRLARALAGLFGLRPEPDVAELMARLPAGARLKQVGFMAGRSARGLRLVIDGMPAVDMLDCLRRIEWPGEMRDAAELVDLVQALAGDAPCRLDLDLGAGVGRGLGIEIPGPTLLKGNTPRELVSAGLISGPAFQALAATLERRTLDRYGAAPDRKRLDFGLNHLKLGRPDGAATPEAKGYFSLLMLPDFSGADLYHAADTSGE